MSGPILITGGTGQLAQALADAAGDLQVLRAGRPDFDFDQPETVSALLARITPSLIVNAAAFTAVDRAETEPDAAARANRDGPALLAQYCERSGIPLLHISTDYVFDGLKAAPYVETDATCPTGIYGSTKLAGEQAVLSACGTAMVLRTSWVYASSGKNFVLTMLNAAARTNRLRVVADQIGCPTAAPDLARALLAVVGRVRAGGWRDEYHGVFHAAGSGWTSWYGLACATFAAASRHDLTHPEVQPITTAEYPLPARRPPDSRLDCSKLEAVLGQRLPDWRIAVTRTVDAAFAARRYSIASD